MSDVGEIVVTVAYDRENRKRVHIDRADPTALISAVLREAIEDRGTEYARIDGDVLTISDDSGERFAYRIGQYEPNLDAYRMEWPD